MLRKVFWWALWQKIRGAECFTGKIEYAKGKYTMPGFIGKKISLCLQFIKVLVNENTRSVPAWGWDEGDKKRLLIYAMKDGFEIGKLELSIKVVFDVDEGIKR